jgi:hypothetical protein
MVQCERIEAQVFREVVGIMTRNVFRDKFYGTAMCCKKSATGTTNTACQLFNISIDS